jgi:hypothetical protein
MQASHRIPWIYISAATMGFSQTIGRTFAAIAINETSIMEIHYDAQ